MENICLLCYYLCKVFCLLDKHIIYRSKENKMFKNIIHKYLNRSTEDTVRETFVIRRNHWRRKDFCTTNLCEMPWEFIFLLRDI